MKVSISLPIEDVEFIDQYARANDRSRSAAVHEAIDTLRNGALADAYEQAWEEWDAEQDGELWEQTSGDGL
jgi:hypothetical protein